MQCVTQRGLVGECDSCQCPARLRILGSQPLCRRPTARLTRSLSASASGPGIAGGTASGSLRIMMLTGRLTVAGPDSDSPEPQAAALRHLQVEHNQ